MTALMWWIYGVGHASLMRRPRRNQRPRLLKSSWSESRPLVTTTAAATEHARGEQGYDDEDDHHHGDPSNPIHATYSMRPAHERHQRAREVTK
jgi:hypothetical protein